MVAAMHRVTGIGGVFIRARDAEALRAWYSEHLGIAIDGDSGAQFTWTAGGSTVFSIFPASSPYFGRPDQPCMLNFRVEDLDAMLAELRAAGAEVIDETAAAEMGSSAGQSTRRGTGSSCGNHHPAPDTSPNEIGVIEFDVRRSAPSTP